MLTHKSRTPTAAGLDVQAEANFLRSALVSLTVKLAQPPVENFLKAFTKRSQQNPQTHTHTQSPLSSPDSHRGRCTSCERFTVLEARSSPGTCLRLKIIIVSRPRFSPRESTLRLPAEGTIPSTLPRVFLPPVITTTWYQSGDITEKESISYFALYQSAPSAPPPICTHRWRSVPLSDSAQKWTQPPFRSHTPSEKIKDLRRGKWHLTLGGILSDITGTTDPTHRVERFRGPCGKEPRENVWRGKPLSNTDNCMCDFKMGLEGSGPIRFPPEPVEQVGNSQMFPTLWKAESVFSVALHSSGIYFTNCLCPAQAHMLQTTAYYV